MPVNIGRAKSGNYAHMPAYRRGGQIETLEVKMKGTRREAPQALAWRLDPAKARRAVRTDKERNLFGPEICGHGRKGGTGGSVTLQYASVLLHEHSVRYGGAVSRRR